MNYNTIRDLAATALHSTVRIHRKNGYYQVYKNGVQVLESIDWIAVKEFALSSSNPHRS